MLLPLVKPAVPMTEKLHSGHRILAMISDVALRDLLAEQFAAETDLHLEHGETADHALTRLAQAALDRIGLVLVDTVLAEMNGVDLCVLIRAAAPDLPVLLLIPPRGEESQHSGSGASELLRKPLRWALLHQRIRHHLGASSNRKDSLSFRSGGKLVIDAQGREIRLTEKEAEILRHLVEAGERATDRQTLLHAIWGYGSGIDTHTLETHIYRLRQKLETDPTAPRLILNEGGGYRLAL